MKCAALDLGIDQRFLDHLSQLCHIMNMPLIVTDYKKSEAARKYYPDIEVMHIENSSVDYEKLAQRYDLFFQSTYRQVGLLEFFASLNKKQLRFIYCPHGNSDKGFKSEILSEIEEQDILLVYGEHMKWRFHEAGVWKRKNSFVEVGNYRLAYYRKRKPFFDALVEEEIFSKLDSNKKTIIFAPTWNDPENSSSFVERSEEVAAIKGYNIIVKAHPLLEHYDPGNFYRLEALFKDKGAIFLCEYPLVYPILERCDYYIGDFSSVGYDFLFYQRPMLFLKERIDKRQLLFDCGKVVEKGEIEKMLKFSWSTGIKKKQKDLYCYAFKEEVPFDNIKKAILKACQHSTPKN